ncbi:PTS sugar transporter subunit IIA [Mollicutes bacterium LVI A0039]|nr:PTS sugar transporter subunit IIA [Mollicutes bacterium LVI A0039]
MSILHFDVEYTLNGGEMHFTAREAKIILKLQQSNISLDQLSEHLQVGQKTIRNDMKNINDKVLSFDSAIEINDQTICFKSIYPDVHWKNIIRLNLSIEEHHLVFLKLLFKEDYITMSDFATEMYMSKSKLEKMIATSPLLNEYVDKKRNVGIAIITSVDQKINLSISILLPYVDDLNYLVTSRALVQQITDKDITVEEFKIAVEKFNSQLTILKNITDNECKILILIILIGTNVLKLSDSNINDLVYKFLFTGENDEKIRSRIYSEVKVILQQNNIVSYDDQVIDALVIHIEAAMFNQFPNIIEDEMELRLKHQYSFAYNVATEIFNRLSFCFKLEWQLFEVNYIAMYIQTMINKNDFFGQNLKVLIVCQYGLSVSNYIQMWIENNVDIGIEFKICSVLDFWNIKCSISNFDVIVTTIDNLEIDQSKVVNVDTVPLDKQLLVVKSKLQKTYMKKQIDQFIDNISLSNIEINTVADVYPLIKEDFSDANDLFLEAMKKRTDSGLTNVNGVIIMHSDSKLISDNKLLIYRLNNPIKVQNVEVKMIFVFAFSSKYIETFNIVIKQIYRVIYSEQYVNALYESQSSNQFMWIFKNQIKGGNYVNK